MSFIFNYIMSSTCKFCFTFHLISKFFFNFMSIILCFTSFIYLIRT